EAGEAGGEHRVPVRDARDGVSQLGARDRLGDVAAGAGSDDGEHVLGRLRDREREEPDVGMGATDRVDHRPASAVRHVDVDKDDVGLALPDELDRGVHLVGVTDDVDRLTQLGPDTRPEQVMVVDQEHADLALAHVRATRRGIVSSTSVPSPGALRMTARPPCRSSRPRIDSVMPLRSAETAVGSKPTPRSRTNSDTCSCSTSANNVTAAAPDHLAAFTAASRPAATSAARSSSSGQSPTVTASTATPWVASTSASTPASAVASDAGASTGVPGGRPSNSQARS